MDASPVGNHWCILAVATVTRKTRHAQLTHHKVKSVLIKFRNYGGNTVISQSLCHMDTTNAPTGTEKNTVSKAAVSWTAYHDKMWCHGCKPGSKWHSLEKYNMEIPIVADQ